MLDLKNYKLN